MCGIVGYVGYDQATPLILSGLKKLEYRGYDSAGVAIYDGNKLNLVKAKGRLQILSDKLDAGAQLKGHLGIGHTRWATHGEPSERNAHPHVSYSGKFAVVHNGIIENYIKLKEKLLNNGINFYSETDTEVIAQLFDYYYNGDLLDTGLKVMAELEGSYALGIICDDKPGELLAMKKDSPLIIGLGKNENFIASDITAVINRTRDIIRLDDNEVALLTSSNVGVYDKDKRLLSKQVSCIDWDIASVEKSGYEHFMLKEIMEQPKVIRDTIKSKIENGEVFFENISLEKEYIKRLSKICIVACGSAYHVGCIAKYIFEKILRIPVEVEVASEFRYKEPIIDDSVLTIAISQSGETADTLAAIREAKKLGSKVLSIVNVIGSSIAAASDEVLYTLAGPEVAVATTKAYSTQLAMVYLLALYMANKMDKIDRSEYNNYVNELLYLPSKVEDILKCRDEIKSLARKFYSCKNVFFIGRNIDYAVSLEGSLKLKEISYIHSEAYPAGELKHGTISLIEEGTLVVALANNNSLFEKMISNIKEVKSRGATVLSITNEKHQEIDEVSDYKILIPDTIDIMSASLEVIPLQIFAYYIALFKGCDIDKPRNLAKSVTVE